MTTSPLSPTEPGDEQTFIEKLNENEEVMEAILRMPQQVNEQLPETRREQAFSVFWEHTSMDKEEVLELVKAREDDFLEMYGEYEVPEWMMRCDAQDKLLKIIHTKFEDESLL